MRFDRTQGDTTAICRPLCEAQDGDHVQFLMSQVDGAKSSRGDAQRFQRNTWAYLPRTGDVSIPGVFRVYWKVTRSDGTTAMEPSGECDYLTVHAAS